MRAAETWHLAVRGLRRRPARTLLTLLGQGVAVAGLLLFLSLGQGLRGQVRQELGSVGPDLQVARPTGGLTLLPAPSLPPSIVGALRSRAGVLGVAEVTPVVAQIKQALDPSQSAVYYGLPARPGIESLFPGVRAARGRVLGPGDEERAVAVLGAGAARMAGVGVGGELAVGRLAQVRVVGVLRPLGTLTDTFTFLPLAAAGRALGTGDRLSLVALRLRDPERAGEVAARLRRELPPELGFVEVSTRDDVWRSAGRVLRGADVLSLGLSLAALLVGGLSVANTMLMTVAERTREFALLRALGARPGVVAGLVLAEGLLLSGLGWALGLGLSLPGVWAVNRATQHLLGVDGAALSPAFALLALGLSLGLGALAGWWPARRAGRVSITRGLAQP